MAPDSLRVLSRIPPITPMSCCFPKSLCLSVIRRLLGLRLRHATGPGRQAGHMRAGKDRMNTSFHTVRTRTAGSKFAAGTQPAATQVQLVYILNAFP